EETVALLARVNWEEQAGPGPKGTPEGGLFELPSLGDFQSKLLDGLTTFLVDRAKQEAAAFFRRMVRERVCKDRGLVYLKNTCAAFADFDLGLSLPAIGRYLHAAAMKDLERFPGVAIAYAMRDHKEAIAPLTAVRIALAFYQGIRDERQPFELARNLHKMR